MSSAPLLRILALLASCLLLLAACGSSAHDAPTRTVGGDSGVLPGHDAGAPDNAPDATPGPGTLLITTTSLPLGDLHTSYKASLGAAGGTTPYAWTVSAGALPAGLTLSSTGDVTGSPTASGMTSFTVRVTDASHPMLSATKALSISVSVVWYVRPDGGTRYTSARITAGLSGQCNGLADAPYPGSGTNQPCAFNDFRFLWDDQTYGNTNQNNWAIQGGDTVIVRGGPWRVGFNSATDTTWCYGGQGPYACSNPTIPAGTAAQHTRILGENFASCSTVTATNKSALTQIFGGFGVDTVLNLAGTQYVDIECLEVTEHNGQCIRVGTPAVPRACVDSGASMDDYDSNGIQTDQTTSNVLFQDIYTHGHTARGFYGPIGGPITMLRVEASFNGFAGWDFDTGQGIADAPGAAIDASYVTMKGNGCNEEYPIVDAFPAISCYDLNSGGFGDAWSGQTCSGACPLESFTCDHCVQAYNTKDGFLGPHVQITNLKITNSASYGNMGEQWKWGTSANSTTVFENNLAIGNCARLDSPMPGAPSGFNANLSLYCRADGDVFSFYSGANSTVLFANNSVVTYTAVPFDMSCASAGTCGSTPYVFRNNIVLGLLNTTSQYAAIGNSGTGELPSLYYQSDSSDMVVDDHNIYYNLRSGWCPSSGNACGDPLFVGEPTLTLTDESSLDNFDFALSSTSPAIGAGVAIPGLTTSYSGQPVANPPDVGAY